MGNRAVIFGCSGLRLTDEETRFYSEMDPWGFILFARNIESHDQIQALTAELRDVVGREAPILIDQEGGRVARLRAPLASEWPNPKDHIAGLPNAIAAQVMHLRYQLIGTELRDLGIDVNCAPMVDLTQADTHDIISDRAYGTEADRVAEVGRAVANGLLAAGVLPIIKHIPGHGRANVDSHLDLPKTDAPLATLLETDFAPFAALSDLPMAMTGHVVFEDIDPEACATLSRRVIDVIRDDIGFGGLLMTDDLSMKALTGRFKDRCGRALAAGCDMILHCNGVMDEMKEVASATPELTEQGQGRADAALLQRKTPKAFDVEGARVRLSDLISSGNAGES